MSNVRNFERRASQLTQGDDLPPGGNPPDNGATMVTHYELDAKLEAIEARADARMSRFEERIEQAIGEMRRTTDRLEAAIGNLKTTTIVTAVSAVVAIVLGVAAFNATLLSNMVASFESGKNTATAITQSTEQIRQTQDQLRALREALEQQSAKK